MIDPIAHVALTWVDETDTSTTTRHFLPSSISPSTAIAEAISLAASAAGLSGCRVARVSVTYRDEGQSETLRGNGTGETGVFIFDTATPGQFALVALPAVRLELHPAPPAGDGITIDPTNLAVFNLVERLVNGPWCNPFGHPISALAAAYIQERQ